MINEIKFVVVVYFEIKETTIPFGDVFLFFALDYCYQIEHAQHLAAGAAARFGRQGIVASVQVFISTIFWSFSFMNLAILMLLVIIRFWDFSASRLTINNIL